MRRGEEKKLRHLWSVKMTSGRFQVSSETKQQQQQQLSNNNQATNFYCDEEKCCLRICFHGRRLEH